MNVHLPTEIWREILSYSMLPINSSISREFADIEESLYRQRSSIVLSKYGGRSYLAAENNDWESVQFMNHYEFLGHNFDIETPSILSMVNHVLTGRTFDIKYRLALMNKEDRMVVIDNIIKETNYKSSVALDWVLRNRIVDGDSLMYLLISQIDRNRIDICNHIYDILRDRRIYPSMDLHSKMILVSDRLGRPDILDYLSCKISNLSKYILDIKYSYMIAELHPEIDEWIKNHHK